MKPGTPFVPRVFFLDTSILIAHLRQKTRPTVFDKAGVTYGIPVVSDLVVFELEVGARRAGRAFEFARHFSALATYPLTQATLMEAAQIQAELLAKNQIISLLDTFIAATAIHHNLPLLTLNSRHFQRVAALQLLAIPT